MLDSDVYFKANLDIAYSRTQLSSPNEFNPEFDIIGTNR